MTADSSHQVKVWGVRVYAGKRRTTHTVRWRVAGREFQETFATAKLAESFRATLLVAQRNFQPFDRETGMPGEQGSRARPVPWIEFGMRLIDAKWPHSSPKHRKGLAEGLVTATCAALPNGGLDPQDVRAALTHWTFNTAARREHDSPPPAYAAAVAWLARHSPSLAGIAEPSRLRPIVDALALRIDGTAASPSTVARKRSALYSAFQYAVELGALGVNPMDKVRWQAPAHTDVVDRRVVVNPHQARLLLAEVQRTYPALQAFFACIYFAALRPAEVRHLFRDNLELPDDVGWGTLHLTGSTQTAGAAWSDSGASTEDRALKHRARKSIRDVPASPELVTALRQHMDRFPPGARGRLFVNRTGRSGVSVSPPFSTPQSMGVVYRVWDLARKAVFTQSEYDSPLAKRPYDLRHAAVSLWLNSGVPATQVAAWAGHSVNVLLRVYASCIVSQDEAARLRVEAALRIGEHK